MKLIIAGGRDLVVTSTFIDEALWQFNVHDRVTEVVSGTASGIDTCGEEWAKNMWRTYPMRTCKVTQFPADWTQYGKAAGPRRNQEMAKYGDALLLIWDGKSKGSAHVKYMAEVAKIPIYEIILRKSCS